MKYEARSVKIEISLVQAKNVIGSFDSLMCADNNVYHAECHSDLPKVGNAHEVADPKIVSRCRMDKYARSVYHSHPLIKPSNFSSGRKSITTKLGKW